MSAHLHSEYVEGLTLLALCRDEEMSALLDENDILRNALREIAREGDATSQALARYVLGSSVSEPREDR